MKALRAPLPTILSCPQGSRPGPSLAGASTGDLAPAVQGRAVAGLVQGQGPGWPPCGHHSLALGTGAPPPAGLALSAVGGPQVHMVGGDGGLADGAGDGGHLRASCPSACPDPLCQAAPACPSPCLWPLAPGSGAGR